MSILRRLPDSRFSEVLPRWVGHAVVILGGGPSLTKEQFRAVEVAHKLERVKVIAVNDSYLAAPYADVQYAADSHWHKWHCEGVAKPLLGLSAEQVRKAWANFVGQKCTIENSGANVKDNSVHMLRNKRGVGVHDAGLSFDPRALITGRSSGSQAINLATLAGSRLILLLGFDAREGQSMTHWHGGHLREMPVAVYGEFRRGFTGAVPDLRAISARVINCSPGTAVTAFEKQSLEIALGLTGVAA